ncbi:MAG: hypothetical protein ACOZHQ_07045 [Thermodesulfobacteriota bacterium]
METQFVEECARMLEQQSRVLAAGLLKPDAQLPVVRELMRGILECEPEQIIAALERQASDPRVLLSWLLYEGEKLPGVDPRKVALVRGLWDRDRRLGQRVMAAPPAPEGLGGAGRDQSM